METHSSSPTLTFLLITFLSVFSTRVVAQACGGSWQLTGSAGFSAGGAFSIGMAMHSPGTPYVVYQDQTLDEKITVMKYNSGAGTWQNVGSPGFSAGEADYTQIAIDGSGTPYVVFQDGPMGSRTTVMKYSTGSWQIVGTEGFSIGNVGYNGIAINGSGTPYVVYQDGAKGDAVTVMKYDSSTGTWQNVGVAGFSVGYADYTHIAIDGSGTPYVTFQDGTVGQKATVMKYNSGGGAWGNVGMEGFSSGEATYTSIAIDGSGTPYVVYQDNGNGNKATVMKYNTITGAWQNVGSAGFSAGEATYTSIAIDGSGMPCVAYNDAANSNKATAMRYNGSNWETLGSAGFSAGSITAGGQENQYLAIDSSGTLFVAYADGANGEKATVQQLTPLTINGATTVQVASHITLTDPTTGGAWSSGNTAIATIGSSTGVVTGVAVGTASVIYTYSGCSDTVAVTVIQQSGVNNVQAANPGLIKVFPNPTPGAFSVEVPAAWKEAELVITDQLGRIIETRKITNNNGAPQQFSLAGMDRGVYLLKVNTGEISEVVKLMLGN